MRLLCISQDETKIIWMSYIYIVRTSEKIEFRVKLACEYSSSYILVFIMRSEYLARCIQFDVIICIIISTAVKSAHAGAKKTSHLVNLVSMAERDDFVYIACKLVFEIIFKMQSIKFTRTNARSLFVQRTYNTTQRVDYHHITTTGCYMLVICERKIRCVTIICCGAVYCSALAVQR